MRFNRGRRSRFGNRKLTYEQAQKIRQKYKLGKYTHKALAKEYEVSLSTIQAILANRTYIHNDPDRRY